MTERLKKLYEDERDSEVAILKDQINIVQAQVDSAQSRLVATQKTGDQLQINEAQTTLNKLLADRADFEAKMIEKYQAFGQKIAAIEDKNDKQLEQVATASYKRITDMAADSLAKMVTGQERPVQALEKLWTGLATTAITSLMKIAAEEVVGMALHQTIAKQEQLDSAKVAAAHVWKEVSGIPVVGPILAPAAAAAAFAAVLAFEGGGVAPRTGMAVLHENERIYTPDHAAKIDKMAENRPSAHATLHYHAASGASAGESRADADRMFKMVSAKFRQMGVRI
jgi:hypothetical protein